MFSLRVLTVKMTRVKAKIALQKIQSNSSHEMVVQLKKKGYTEGTKENCFKQTDTHSVLKSWTPLYCCINSSKSVSAKN